ncbi:MAG TPA: glycosyl hydrolase family 65 protein [Nitrospiraceae bacterium]|nr:glycosyl hydrolase family 65 protein [Nitrospiraceae bacterium]
MIHRPQFHPPPHIYPPDEWNLIEKRFMPQLLEQDETMFALGNGYLGMRGCFEEGGPIGQNGTFINGFYEGWPIVYPEEAYGLATAGQTIVNVTDTKIIKLYVDDEPFWLPHANVRQFDRRLNMQAGTLDRDILWETPAGKRVLISSRRLVSFEHRHLAAIFYQVTLLNAAAPIVLSAEMIANEPVPRRPNYDPRQAKVFTQKVLQHRLSYAKDQRIVLCHATNKSGLSLSCAIDHVLETTCPMTWATHYTEDAGQVVATINAEPGRPITLVKYMGYHTSHTAPPEELCARVERTMDRAVADGFPALLASQKRYLDDFWQRSNITVTTNPARAQASTTAVQQAIRFNLFHILQAAARAENTGVPAKGLTGGAYEGHYFWDSEIYVLPFLIYTAPRIAKNLLRFRHGMLDLARERARQLNQRGAMYPWRTINGEEASAYYAAGTAQYHINADIIYALKKYVQATGDEEFLFEEGVEMLVETARLWLSLGFYSPRKGGQFCIHCVTGPDEYSTMVDNNTYTNLMARENLRYAADTVEKLREQRPDLFTALTHKVRLDLLEVSEWKRAAEHMYIAFDERTQITPQDDQFLDQEPWDFERTPPTKYPLLLYFHPLTIYRYQVIKQADLVLVMLLLGHEFSSDLKRRNFEFYDPITTGDSSLSPCIQSIMAAEVGDMEKALEYARVATLMDLGDVAGNVKDGCHIAAMGGVWMVFVYGFAGLRDYHGELHFRPTLPNVLDCLRFELMFQGQILEVHIGQETTQYTMKTGNGLQLRHDGKEILLSPEVPTVDCPNRKPSE